MKKVISIGSVVIVITYVVIMLWNLPDIKNDTLMFEKGMNTYKYLIEDVNLDTEEVDKIYSKDNSIYIDFKDGTTYSIHYKYKGLNVISNQEVTIPLNLKWSFIQLNIERLIDFSTGDLDLSWDRIFNQIDVVREYGEYTEVYSNYEIKMKIEDEFFRVFIKKIE